MSKKNPHVLLLDAAEREVATTPVAMKVGSAAMIGAIRAGVAKAVAANPSLFQEYELNFLQQDIENLIVFLNRGFYDAGTIAGDLQRVGDPTHMFSEEEREAALVRLARRVKWILHMSKPQDREAYVVLNSLAKAEGTSIENIMRRTLMSAISLLWGGQHTPKRHREGRRVGKRQRWESIGMAIK